MSEEKKQIPLGELFNRAVKSLKDGKPKFATAEELVEEVRDYFRSDEIPTWNGFTTYVFGNGTTLHRYRKKPEFAPIIFATQQVIASYYERSLSDKNPGGSIFWLKARGGDFDQQWTDTQRLEITTLEHELEDFVKIRAKSVDLKQIEQRVTWDDTAEIEPV